MGNTLARFRVNTGREERIADFIEKISSAPAAEEERLFAFQEFNRLFRAYLDLKKGLFRSKHIAAKAADSITSNVSVLSETTFPKLSGSLECFAIAATWFTEKQLSPYMSSVTQILATYLSTAEGEPPVHEHKVTAEARRAVARLAASPLNLRVFNLVVPGRVLIPAVVAILSEAEAGGAEPPAEEDPAAAPDNSANNEYWQSIFRSGEEGAGMKALTEACEKDEEIDRDVLLGLFNAFGYNTAAKSFQRKSGKELCALAHTVADQFEMASFGFSKDQAAVCSEEEDLFLGTVYADVDNRRVVVMVKHQYDATNKKFLHEDGQKHRACMTRPSLKRLLDNTSPPYCDKEAGTCKVAGSGVVFKYDDVAKAVAEMRAAADGESEDAFESGVFRLEFKTDSDIVAQRLFRVVMMNDGVPTPARPTVETGPSPRLSPKDAPAAAPAEAPARPASAPAAPAPAAVPARPFYASAPAAPARPAYASAPAAPAPVAAPVRPAYASAPAAPAPVAAPVRPAYASAPAAPAPAAPAYASAPAAPAPAAPAYASAPAAPAPVAAPVRPTYASAPAAPAPMAAPVRPAYASAPAAPAPAAAPARPTYASAPAAPAPVAAPVRPAYASATGVPAPAAPMSNTEKNYADTMSAFTDAILASRSQPPPAAASPRRSPAPAADPFNPLVNVFRASPAPAAPAAPATPAPAAASPRRSPAPAADPFNTLVDVFRASPAPAAPVPAAPAPVTLLRPKFTARPPAPIRRAAGSAPAGVSNLVTQPPVMVPVSTRPITRQTSPWDATAPVPTPPSSFASIASFASAPDTDTLLASIPSTTTEATVRRLLSAR